MPARRAQRELLRVVLNRVIPPSDQLPGAGDVDVDDSIERAMAESVELRRLLLDGLSEIAIEAQRSLADLDRASQTLVLESVERRSPRFFAALVEHTYRGYYVLPVVQRAVGYEARPPQPLGHALPPFDSALLAQQRSRPPFWRRVGPRAVPTAGA
jgi:hypothetical protein